jgi:A/G-specific adenine glycosylase
MKTKHSLGEGRDAGLARPRAEALQSPSMSGEEFSPAQLRQFRRLLLAWFDEHARNLPWRRSSDPYAIWVSEIMLQQTRVNAVLDHYALFMARFPTMQALAAAKEPDVLAIWSGLGYYRRARMLHKAVQFVTTELAGIMPRTAAELRALPGIGEYTSAAIASIAFGEAAAVVDGNVERVVTRLAGLVPAPDGKANVLDRAVRQTAGRLLEQTRPGDFNQAMMELGAVVCTPRTPSCLTCPVVALCATRGELPATTKPARQMKREIHYALHRRDGQVFLIRRPPDASLMPGMWELPELPGLNGAGTPSLTLRHSITITDYTVRVWHGTAPSRVAGKWIPVERLRQVALTGLARKILRKSEVL